MSIASKRRGLATPSVATADPEPPLMAVIDREGIILAVNSAWEDAARAGGLSWEDNGVGRSYLGVCDACGSAATAEADEARQAAQGIRHVLSGASKRFRMEYRCEGSGGPEDWFWLEVTGLTGSWGGAVVVHRCVTDSRLQEEWLADRGRRQEAVAALGRRALDEDDLGHLMRETVESIAETLGVERCAVLRFSGADRELHCEAGVGWPAGEGGKPWLPDEVREQARDSLRVLDTVTLAPGESGGAVGSGLCTPLWAGSEPYGVVCVYARGERVFSGDDVLYLQTAGTILSEAILHFQDVAERRSLATQLRQAQKMETLGRLTGGVAHDFNNLVMVILGHCELLQAEFGDNPRLRKQLEQIRWASDRAVKLVRQLLTFSRQQEPRLVVVDLNEVLTDMADLLSRLLGAHVDLRIRLGSAASFVRADRGRLEQVIVNLAANARDAMSGGGVLTLEATHTELGRDFLRQHSREEDGPGEGGPYVRLCVRDTGSGISEDDLPRIFQPFFTTKDRPDGTGLGLATVASIVKQHGGLVRVESRAGEGTCFEVYLPRVSDPAVATGTASRDADVAGGLETILLVEDEKTVRKLVRRILENLGYEILEAGESTAALEWANRYPGPIHLMLSDVVLPGMSGPELAGRIAGVRPGTKVLFISGYTDQQLEDHGVAGRVDMLRKPFRVRSLATAVRRVLDTAPKGSSA